LYRNWVLGFRLAHFLESARGFPRIQKIPMGARFIAGFVLSAAFGLGASDVLQQADRLYKHTDYHASLRLLASERNPDAAFYSLMGKDHFMLGEYKKAVEAFEKAATMEPSNSMYQLWLGRAYGRRAESGGWLTAGGNAVKARQSFEKAVALDPNNREALNDLFDYYLNAPGMLGGGTDKAEAIARRIANQRPAESEFEQAQLAEHRKEFDAAEQHLRRAVEFAPREVGRVLDLARFLAKRGRLEESDARFTEAEKLAPQDPGVAFAEAKVDIENRRKLERARKLLVQYLAAEITPDDPPKQDAEQLLRTADGLLAGSGRAN
jgi:Flp pilus assembly protein TadD